MLKQFSHSVFILCAGIMILACAASDPYISSLEQNLHPFPPQMESQFKDASAVFLWNTAHVEINESRSTLVKRHVAVQILNKRGFGYANVTLPFSSNTDITQIHARTLLPDGRIISLRSDQIFNINLFPDFIFYSDVKAKRFTMPSVETGCIVEYQWTQCLPPQTNLPRWNFQQEEPVLKSKITILCPRTLNIDYHLSAHYIPVSESIEPYKNYMKYQWSAEQIPPILTESAMPPNDQETAHLLFSTTNFRSWNDAADYFKQLIGNRFKPDAQIKETTLQLTKKFTGQQQQLQAIFEYVRDQIRYIAIEIGIGGYQPHFSSHVFLNKYGDCKDMAGLLISMASVLEIDVKPALISNWYNGGIDTSIVNLSQFNHVIAFARLSDGSEIWMDPTEKYEAFGRLPWYDQNAVALITGESGHLQQTPSDDVDQNLSSRFWSVDLYEDGQATGTVDLRFDGAQAIELRRQLSDMHPRETTAWFGQELLTLFPVQKYYVIQIEHLTDLRRTLNINSGFFTNSKFTFQNDDILSLYPGSFTAFNWARLFPNQPRNYPVVLRHPVATRDEIHIRYPKNWHYLTGTQSDSLITPIGYYRWSIRQADATLIFERTFKIERTVIPPEEYPAFVQFLSSVASGDQTLIQFQQK